jgi:hypothetical protein
MSGWNILTMCLNAKFKTNENMMNILLETAFEPNQFEYDTGWCQHIARSSITQNHFIRVPLNIYTVLFKTTDVILHIYAYMSDSSDISKSFKDFGVVQIECKNKASKASLWSITCCNSRKLEVLTQFGNRISCTFFNVGIMQSKHSTTMSWFTAWNIEPHRQTTIKIPTFAHIHQLSILWQWLRADLDLLQFNNAHQCLTIQQFDVCSEQLVYVMFTVRNE